MEVRTGAFERDGRSGKKRPHKGWLCSIWLSQEGSWAGSVIHRPFFSIVCWWVDLLILDHDHVHQLKVPEVAFLLLSLYSSVPLCKRQSCGSSLRNPFKYNVMLFDISNFSYFTYWNIFITGIVDPFSRAEQERIVRISRNKQAKECVRVPVGRPQPRWATCVWHWLLLTCLLLHW